MWQEQHAKVRKDTHRSSHRKSDKGEDHSEPMGDDHPEPTQTEEPCPTPAAGTSSEAKERAECEESEPVPEGEYSMLDDPDVVVLSAGKEARELDAQLSEERNSV